MKPSLFLLSFATVNLTGRAGANEGVATNAAGLRLAKRGSIRPRSPTNDEERSGGAVRSSSQRALPSLSASGAQRNFQSSSLPAIGVDPAFRTRLLRSTALEPFARQMDRNRQPSRRERRRQRHRNAGRFLCCLTAFTCVFLGALAYDRCHEISEAAQVRLKASTQLDQRLLVLNKVEGELETLMHTVHTEHAMLHGPAQQRQGAALSTLNARLTVHQREAKELARMILQLKELELQPMRTGPDETLRQRLAAAIKNRTREDVGRAQNLQTEMFSLFAEAAKHRQVGKLLTAQEHDGVMVGIPTPEGPKLSVHRQVHSKPT